MVKSSNMLAFLSHTLRKRDFIRIQNRDGYPNNKWMCNKRS